MRDCTDEVVDIAQVAMRLEVQADTVRMWRKRGVLPAPAGFISGAPWWYWPIIQEWAYKTRRLEFR